MRLFHCQCGQTLYYDSVECVSCHQPCGWCDACQAVQTMLPAGEQCCCSNRECGQTLVKCDNFCVHAVCNCYITTVAVDGQTLCRSCVSTTVIPQLTDQNLVTWRALEAAKRRLLYQLDSLNLPGGRYTDVSPKLTFEFLEDRLSQPVFTGHQDGVVTVNLKEANPVQREIERQKFDEPQRTLIGHLRHEVSHYLWQVLVEGIHEQAFVDVFGDHQSPHYDVAIPAYYDQGAPNGWQTNFISPYASSHPWEDFAETSAFYFDMHSVLETLTEFKRFAYPREPGENCCQMLADFCDFGAAANEINRCLGLTDLLPEVISPTVASKLEFVHSIYHRVVPGS